ncbi:MAG: amidohydrolase family protein [Chloroflexi bacterium]|nr:amidohydrolase family protein [Chloroflexota bacterium]
MWTFDDFKYIDTHVHILPPHLHDATVRLFQQRKDEGYWDVIFQQSPPHLIDYLLSLRVERFFIINNAYKPNVSHQLNLWTYRLANQYSQAVAIGSVHPLDNNPLAVLDEAFLELGAVGLKVHPRIQGVGPDDERMFPIYERLIELNQPVFFHAGTTPIADSYCGYEHFERLLQRYPQLSVVIANMGLQETEHFFDLMEAYENVWMDNALTFSNEKCFGYHSTLDNICHFQDRIMYGSDFPLLWLEPRVVVERFLSEGLDREIYEKIFYWNALRFLERYPPLNAETPQKGRASRA